MSRSYKGVPFSSLTEPKVRDMIAVIDTFLRDVDASLGRISRGQVPNSSGNPIAPPSIDLSQYFFLPGRASGQIAHGTTPGGSTATYPNQLGALILKSSPNTWNSYEVFFDHSGAINQLAWGIGVNGSAGIYYSVDLGMDNAKRVFVGDVPWPLSSQFEVRGSSSIPAFKLSGSDSSGTYAPLVRIYEISRGATLVQRAALLESMQTIAPSSESIFLFGKEARTGRAGIFLSNHDFAAETVRISTGKSMILSGMDTATNNHVQAQGNTLTLDFANVTFTGTISVPTTSIAKWSITNGSSNQTTTIIVGNGHYQISSYLFCSVSDPASSATVGAYISFKNSPTGGAPTKIRTLHSDVPISTLSADSSFTTTAYVGNGGGIDVTTVVSGDIKTGKYTIYVFAEKIS